MNICGCSNMPYSVERSNLKKALYFLRDFPKSARQVTRTFEYRYLDTRHRSGKAYDCRSCSGLVVNHPNWRLPALAPRPVKMRVVIRKGEKSTLRKTSTSTRAMWKFMLKSLNYGPANDKICVSPSSFFGLPLAQFSPDDEQLPTQVEVSWKYLLIQLLFYIYSAELRVAMNRS